MLNYKLNINNCIKCHGKTYVYCDEDETNDTVDMNDDSWDEISDLNGVVDVGYGYGYGIEGKYEDSLLIELDDSIVESTKSKKSLKENKSLEFHNLIDELDSIVNYHNKNLTKNQYYTLSELLDFIKDNHIEYLLD